MCSPGCFNTRGILIICAQAKLLYRVLQGLDKLCESRGGGIARVWSHIPHQGKDALHGNAMASLMENVTLGWLHGLLCKECPELTPAHLPPSLQAGSSPPRCYQPRQRVPGTPGTCAPRRARGNQLCVMLSAWCGKQLNCPC